MCVCRIIIWLGIVTDEAVACRSYPDQTSGVNALSACAGIGGKGSTGVLIEIPLICYNL